MTITASGIEPGQRRLNNIQTSGRTYRNVTEPSFEIDRTNNVGIETRDGTTLFADVYRPKADAKFPALVSFSGYPRQIQDLGAPVGFIEAGTTDGTATSLTGGWLRAMLREVNEKQSVPGAPVLDCTHPVSVPIGDTVTYRIPIVPNARRIAAGHRLRIVLASDDQPKGAPTLLGFTHTPIAQPSLNTVFSSSRLLLPLLAGA